MCFPGLQSAADVTARAENGSDFVVISWKYQSNVTYYRIFFRDFHTVDGNPSTASVGPIPVHCDNNACHYCVSNSNSGVSCSELNKNYKFSIGSNMDFEDVVSVKVEACRNILPNSCMGDTEWKNYTIPPGGK